MPKWHYYEPRMTNRYVVVNDRPILAVVAQTRTSSEAAILWFLHAYYLEHRRGATKEEVLTNAHISERTFKRAWPKLRGEGLVVDEQRYSITTAGMEALRTG